MNQTVQNANCQGVLHKELFESDNTKRIVKVCYTRSCLNQTVQNANCQGVLHKELFESDNTNCELSRCATQGAF